MKKKMRTLIVLVLATALTASIAEAQDITTGLVGHWKLDEIDGITADNSVSGVATERSRAILIFLPGQPG